jgi:hypothetical protein
LDLSCGSGVFGLEVVDVGEAAFGNFGAVVVLRHTKAVGGEVFDCPRFVGEQEERLKSLTSFFCELLIVA